MLEAAKDEPQNFTDVTGVCAAYVSTPQWQGWDSATVTALIGLFFLDVWPSEGFLGKSVLLDTDRGQWHVEFLLPLSSQTLSCRHI